MSQPKSMSESERQLVELLVSNGLTEWNAEHMDEAKRLVDGIRASRAPLELLEDGLRKAIAYEVARAEWANVSQRLGHAGVDFTGRVTAGRDMLERLIAERKSGG